MLNKLFFSGGETGNGMFKEPGIIIDGGRLKTEPWEVFKELEKDLGLLPYFDRSKFTQRPDGYFWDGLIYISSPKTKFFLSYSLESFFTKFKNHIFSAIID